MVRLTSMSTIEGQLLRGRLEAEGIPVMQKGGDESPYRLGPVELWVPEEDLEDAQEVLRAVTSGELEDSLDENEPA
jgi:Putative prokaryotic signal transducing protein